jgi:hypothetical protein
MKYAIVANNKVTQIVEAPTKPENGIEARGPVQVGWIYIPAERGPQFFRPDAPARPQRQTMAESVNVMSSGAFLLKFTQPERTAIRAAAKQNAQLDDFLYLLENFSTVDKTNPVVVAGLSALTAVGLLAAGRQAEILT